MIKYAETNKVYYTKATPHGWDIVRTPSRSTAGKYYTVDVTNGRCSCPAWIFQKGGERKPCKHLRALGFTQVIRIADIKEPAKLSKAQKEALPIVETE